MSGILPPGPDLPKLIKNALDVSRFFVLLASPDAVKSDWVNDELRIWVVEKSQTDRLIVVLTERWLRLVGQSRAFLKWCLADC